MAGHMGDQQVTIRNLEVVDVVAEDNVLVIKGAVPGPNGGYVLVRDAKKRAAPKDLPFPAAVRGGAPEAAAEQPAEKKE